MGTADNSMGNREVMRALIVQIGSRKLLILIMLMLIASLTEGVGLLLLVPITLLIIGQVDGGPNGWLASLADWPPEVLLAGFVALVGARAVIVYAANERRRSAGLELTRQLRQSAHMAIMGAEWRWLSGQHSGDHAALMMGEADRAGVLADQGLTALTYTLTLFVLLVTSVLISAPLTLVIVGLGLAAIWPVWLLRRLRGAEEGHYTQAYLDLQRVVSGGLDHLRAARIGRGMPQFARDFAYGSAQLERLELSYFRAGHRILVLFQLIAAALLALFIYLAIFVWAMPLAYVVPILALSVRAVPMISGLQQALRGWKHACPAMGGILSLIDEARMHAEPHIDAAQTVPLRQSIELSDVSLSFPGRVKPVLDRFSLSIPAGSIIAIYGPSGVGKSSLADVLSGLIAPDSGTLLVDGQVLDGAVRLGWRKHVAYVEQRPFFIDGTIAQNMTWDDVATSDEQMQSALDAASAGFVDDLPQGLATRIGEGARQLSGGERQRISLARALLCNPDLLILDEVTAGLDQSNADAIRTSIAALRGKMTVVVLGHDPAMAALADHVVELSGG